MLSRCTAARRERVNGVFEKLIGIYVGRVKEKGESYGDGVRTRKKWSGIDVLVLAMLSQNTNMINARRGYRMLRRAMPTWEEVMRAPVEKVQREIAVCGLARMRAWRLIKLLREIEGRHGKLCIQFLKEKSMEEGMGYLRSYFGIGPKTAAYTLLFGFGKDVFPVDGGIWRMARRLGIVRAKATDEEVSVAVGKMLEPGRCFGLHVMMFEHAKVVCRARNPKCAECVVSGLCPEGKRRLRHRGTEVGKIEMKNRVIRSARWVSAGVAKRGVWENPKSETRNPNQVRTAKD